MTSYYLQRNNLLSELGFTSYSDYRKSTLWKVIRGIVVSRDSKECCATLCGNSAWTVHHLSYTRETLLGVSPCQLICLCHECHEHVEFENGSKLLDLDRVRQRTLQLVCPHKGRRGISGYQIGTWYRSRWLANRHTARQIVAKLKAVELRWYNQIVKDLNLGLIHPKYVKYLGLRK